MPAMLTRIGPTLGDPMKLGRYAATWAIELMPAVLDVEYLIQTGRVVRIFGLELFEGEM
jgi:hypothetical protein